MNRARWKLVYYFIYHIAPYLQHIHNHMLPKPDDKYPKIFCIGKQRTGTTSLHKALKILGFHPAQVLDLSTWSKKGQISYLKKLKNWNYDAYLDFPFSHEDCYLKVDKMYPNSKFILTIRDKKSHIRSYYTYFKHSKWFKEDPKRVLEDADLILLRNKEIIEYFKDRSDQLLVMNITKGDGWEKLCKFLDKPIPDQPFPHKNLTKYKT